MRAYSLGLLSVGALLLAAPAWAQSPPATKAPSPSGPLPVAGTKAPPTGNKTIAPQVTPPAKPVDLDPWAGRSDLFVPPSLQPTTKVTLGAVARTTTSNGMQLVVVPRKQLPAVEVTLALRVPETAEPLDRTGVADFMAQMLRKGAGKRTADQLSEAIDFVGGDIGAADAHGAIYIACHARARDVALCFELIGDLAMRPTFPEAEMGEIRDRLLASINQVKDDPESLSRWHAANVFYGDDDPRGRPMSRRSLAAIDRKSLVEFHDKWFAPNNAILAVSGDVDDKSVHALAQKTFGGWARHATPPVIEPPPRPLPVAKALPVRLVDKPDATQSVILLLGPGIKESDPSLYAVKLMNYTLGGGVFSSRLMKVVRSEGGKTYAVSSSFETGREAGPFEASTFTRNKETTATLALIREQIAKMRDKGPTADELKAAKNNLIGGYGLKLETGADLAESLLGSEIDGLDRNFVADYPGRLEAVSLADAQKAAADHLDPRALVIVGKASEVGPMLKQAGYGKIEVVSYLEPVSAAERHEERSARAAKAEVLPSDALEGRRLLELAIKAKGGPAALAKIKSLELVGKGTLTAQGQSVPVTLDIREAGGSVREDMEMGPMRLTQVYTPSRSFVRQGDKEIDMPPDMKAEMQKAMFRDPNFILTNAQQPNTKLRGSRSVSVGDVNFEAFDVISPDNDVTRVLLDPKTHLISRLVYVSEGKEVHDDLGDYRIQEGVSFPFKLKHDTGAEKLEVVYDKVGFNPDLPPSLFQ
jgi:zinc protease